MFANIKDLQNIKILSAIRHFFSFTSATWRSLQTDFYKIVMIEFPTKFNQNLLGWSLVYGQQPTLPQTYIWDNWSNWDILATDKQTNKQRWKQWWNRSYWYAYLSPPLTDLFCKKKIFSSSHAWVKKGNDLFYVILH